MNRLDLGPLPEQHPRDEIVRAAHRELAEQLEHIRINYCLTWAEYFSITAQCNATTAGRVLAMERRHD